MIDIGSNIREIRLRKNLTQTDLGDAIGASKITISRYERNHRAFDIEVLQRISNALGVSIIELIGDSATTAPAPSTPSCDTPSSCDAPYIEHRIDRLMSMFMSCPSDTQMRILSVVEAFEKLNRSGQKRLAGYARDLTELPRYKNN